MRVNARMYHAWLGAALVLMTVVDVGEWQTGQLQMMEVLASVGMLAATLGDIVVTAMRRCCFVGAEAAPAQGRHWMLFGATLAVAVSGELNVQVVRLAETMNFRPLLVFMLALTIVTLALHFGVLLAIPALIFLAAMGEHYVLPTIGQSINP